ncbi:hypothetical protein DO109_23130 [Salmonella enterica]|nr:hypothetical protein [Salmonella enterica]
MAAQQRLNEYDYKKTPGNINQHFYRHFQEREVMNNYKTNLAKSKTGMQVAPELLKQFEAIPEKTVKAILENCTIRIELKSGHTKIINKDTGKPGIFQK